MKFIQTFLFAILTQKLHYFWLPRFFGLLFMPGFIFDIEILLLFQALILLHASLGLEAILEDYLHVEVIKYQYLSLVKLFSILLINLNILYLL
uniref:Succinate:cytochrome c oxidoreductase subunit 4 n=1 Tax=Bangia fuscopurpurea TaxID=101920 RepID=A0A0E3GPI1_BANFU|nr:succinate:cytochrome c oxidoreductase subunit 4 [Bangia fuscopurpurea]AKA66490.1 succinate:cytochrome c oxidoreductase subunit 4 [Bangia fuscopurpurea]